MVAHNILLVHRVIYHLPYALHTQYIVRTDPPFLGGLRFMPAGVDA